VHKVHRVLRVILAIRGQPAQLDLRVRRESKVLLEKLAQPVHKVILEHKERKATPAIQVRLVQPVRKAQRVLLEPKEIKETPDPRDHKEFKE
jgi:hypothetical protein